MSKKKFSPIRIEDLTGGINCRDYPSEIEDKQAQSIANWNFEGNKLVSEKGFTDTSNTTTLNIGGMTIDTGDIWTVAEGVIYKNGTLVQDGTGILISVNTTNFKSGVNLYITIEGNDYEVTGADAKEFIYNLKALVEADGLITKAQDDLILIRKVDGTTVSYSYSPNLAYLIYNKESTAYSYGKKYYWNIEVNGIEYRGIYTMSVDLMNAGQVDLELIGEIYDALPGTISKTKVNLDSTLSVVTNYDTNAGIILNNISSASTQGARYIDRYNIKNYLSTTFINPASGLIVDGNNIAGLYAYKVTAWGTTTTYNGTINLEGNILTLSGSYTNSALISTIVDWIRGLGHTANFDGTYLLYAKKDGTPITSFALNITAGGSSWIDGLNIASLVGGSGYTGLSLLVFNTLALKTRIVNQIYALLLYDVYENTISGVTYLQISKKDFSPLTVSGAVNVNYIQAELSVGVTADIRAKDYGQGELNITPLELGDGLLGRANIVIGNLGALTIDKDDGGAFYTYEGLNIKIGESSIGLPTVGTIYNGKIVLGGYYGNDNIVFSKTSSPTFPLNVLNFSDYDSGGQSISGGDKGSITGMTVGENGLYVFKDNSVWYSNSEKDNPTSKSFNLVFRKITSSGALSQNVITEVEQETFYLDWKTRTVRRLGYEQNLTTLRDTGISDEIKTLFKELPEEQSLATSSFLYPNYRLSLSDGTGGTITYPNGKTYNIPNIHFIYNVDNKSWTTSSDLDTTLISKEGYVALTDGKVYKTGTGNTLEEGYFRSKLYTLGGDSDFKKLGRIDFIGKIIPEATKTKTLIIEIYFDGELIEERKLDFTSTSDIIERIDLYDIGRGYEFILRHSGEGKIEIYDVYPFVKATKIQDNYF